MPGPLLHKANILLAPVSSKVQNMFHCSLPSSSKSFGFWNWKLCSHSLQFFPKAADIHSARSDYGNLPAHTPKQQMKTVSWLLPGWHQSEEGICSLRTYKRKKVCFFNWWHILHADEFHMYFSSSNLSPELQAPISNNLLTFLLACLAGISNLRSKQNLILNLPSAKTK